MNLMFKVVQEQLRSNGKIMRSLKTHQLAWLEKSHNFFSYLDQNTSNNSQTMQESLGLLWSSNHGVANVETSKKVWGTDYVGDTRKSNQLVVVNVVPAASC